MVRTNALRRTFVSVKGFYFQAEVVGQPVTWLVPHALSQVCTTFTTRIDHTHCPESARYRGQTDCA